MTNRMASRFVDVLEARQLLSGTASLDNGVLTITGTAGNDEIYVDKSLTPGRLSVNINMKFQDFAAADVQSIHIDAGAGDDYIGVGGFRINPVYEDVNQGAQRSLSAPAAASGSRHVSGKTMAKRLAGARVVSGKTMAKRNEGVRIVSGKTLAKRAVALAAKRSLDSTPAAPQPGDPPVGTFDSIPAVIVGGDGNDTLHGSDSNDTIIGGNGNDLIQGYGGDDSLTGGNGNDTVLGGLGNDLIDGGNGDDLLAGNATYYYTQVFARDANGEITSGQTFLVPISDDGFTDTVIGGAGADTFHTTDAGEVQDQAAADQVSNESIRNEDVL